MKCKIVINTTTELVIPKFEDFEKEVDNAQIPLTGNFVWVLMDDNGVYKLSPYRTKTEYVGKVKPSIKNSSLTFDTLRKANIARLPEFKNSKGEPAHSKPDGSDWSTAQWLQAVIGELGEYANVMKKVERGDLTFEEAKPLIEKELADVMTYLDILAFRVDVDLSKAVENKFNEVSERVGCSLRIENNEVVRREKCRTSIFENYDYNTKNGELTPRVTNEGFKAATEACKIPKDQVKGLNKTSAFQIIGLFSQVCKEKLNNITYPLEIPRDQIIDVFAFDFEGMDDGKQYRFYSVRELNCPIFNIRQTVYRNWIFEFFSKQLGTKITGMLINGSREITKLNPGDLIQFYDDRNVLYNFRLVKSSDKNVEVTAT